MKRSFKVVSLLLLALTTIFILASCDDDGKPFLKRGNGDDVPAGCGIKFTLVDSIITVDEDPEDYPAAAVLAHFKEYKSFTYRLNGDSKTATLNISESSNVGDTFYLQLEPGEAWYICNEECMMTGHKRVYLMPLTGSEFTITAGNYTECRISLEDDN